MKRATVTDIPASSNAKGEPWVRNVLDFDWYCGAGHTESALSKRLVGPDNGSVNIGYVISSYAPGHSMSPHTHRLRDQVYHILDGQGVMTINGKRRRVEKHDIAFLPAGVQHGLANESFTDLVFVIVSSPASEPSPE